MYPQAKEFFRRMGIQVVTGSRYLGGFVGERDTEACWIQEKVEGWAEYLIWHRGPPAHP